jgi:DMSO/TMAO reductase YedYZ molybdopterin-dependent catalytic subunit
MVAADADAMTTTAVLDVLTTDPYNAQASREALREDRTPAAACFVRSHFAVPRIDTDQWRLRLPGPAGLTYPQLLTLPSKAVDVVLECAGNGRSGMAPCPPGLAWGDRAVSCVRFYGVPLRLVLGRLPAGTREVVFRGADSGVAHGRWARFERSLPVRTALHPDTLLATHMNGLPLTPEHGAPVRLVVPGWYGVASVKWLVEIRAVTEPFHGLFQTEQYVVADRPITTTLVKSMITDPVTDVALSGHPVEIHGHAWSNARITSVEVSTDGGRTWSAATLRHGTGHAWTEWSIDWTPCRRGRYRLLARAHDATGAAQPMSAPWNSLGYGNNVVASTEVEVT